MLAGKKSSEDKKSASANVAGAAAEAGASAAKVPIIGPALALAAIAAVGVAGYKLLTKAPPKMETGGVVKESGIAEVHKGEVFSGTKNEMGFGGTDMTATNNKINETNRKLGVLTEKMEFLLTKQIRATQDVQMG